MKAAAQYPVVLTARIVSAALTALSLLLLAQASGPEEFGWFAAVFAVCSVALGLGDLGYQTLAVRLHARVEKRGESAAAMAVQRVWTLRIAGAMLAIFLVLVLANILPGWCLILVVWQWLEKEVRGRLGIALAERRAIEQLLTLSVERGLGLILYLVGARFFSNLYAFTIAMTIGALAAMAIVSRVDPTFKLRSSLILSPADKRRSRHYWWASASAQVRTMDAAVLSIAATPLEAGLYALPSRLTAPLKIAATAISTVSLPAASRGDREELQALKKMMKAITGACWIGLLLSFVFAESIVVATVGDSFSGSVTPLRILLIGLALNIPGSFVSGLLQGSGYERQIGRLGIILGVLTLVLVSIGGLYSGAIGAAAAVTVVYLVQFILVMALYRRIKR